MRVGRTGAFSLMLPAETDFAISLVSDERTVSWLMLLTTYVALMALAPAARASEVERRVVKRILMVWV